MSHAGSSRIDAAVVAYTHWVQRRRWAVIAVSLGLAIGTGMGMGALQFKNNYRVFFGPTNPHLQAFEAIQNVYTKNDNALFVITPADGKVFTPETLTAVAQLTEEAWTLPYSIRVDSITNFQNMQAEDDDLVVEDLVTDPAAAVGATARALLQTALAEPALRNRLINEDGSVTAVNVTFQLPENSGQEAPEAVAKIRELRERIVAAHPQVEIRLTGAMMMNNAFFEASKHDIETLIPTMFAGIFVMMWLLLRSLRAALLTMAVIVLAIVTAMGAAGWMGIFLTSPSAGAPTIIMTLAVADCVHVLLSAFVAARQGAARDDAIAESLRINLKPVFLTSVTTAIGFLTMNFSDSPPFHDLGNITAMGVMAALFYSVFFLPAAATLVPMRGHASSGAYDRTMARFAEFVIARKRGILIASLALATLIVACVPRNELDDEFVKYFGHSIEFRRDTDYALENLSGIAQIHFSLPAPEGETISDPEYMRTLDAFAEWFRAQPATHHVSSISDTFKRLNRNLNGDDPDYYRLPERPELAAQYLLVYEMSLPFGLDMNNQINIDKTATQFVATVGDLSSKELRALTASAEDWLASNAPQMDAKGIGISLMFSHISARNIRGMLTGTAISLVVISAILLLALRDWRLGLLSLVPNLLPAALTFGIWGLLVGQVNMAASVVAAMSLGIVVDDTVHFLSKYQRARRERGLNPADAVRFAFSTVGVALVATTAILVAGFSVLAFSPFEINAVMAKLTAMAIAIALAVDFFLLPVLLLHLDRAEPAAALRAEIHEEEPRALIS